MFVSVRAAEVSAPNYCCKMMLRLQKSIPTKIVAVCPPPPPSIHTPQDIFSGIFTGQRVCEKKNPYQDRPINFS